MALKGVRFLLILAVVVAAGPAWAMDLTPEAQAALDRGKPYAEVRRDADGSSGMIRAAIDIAAPQAAVWSVMTDCALAPRMVDNLKSCRILDRDPQGRWDIREQVSRMTFIPSVRTGFREDFDAPRKMTFHRTGGQTIWIDNLAVSAD